MKTKKKKIVKVNYNKQNIQKLKNMELGTMNTTGQF